MIDIYGINIISDLLDMYLMEKYWWARTDPNNRSTKATNMISFEVSLILNKCSRLRNGGISGAAVSSLKVKYN